MRILPQLAHLQKALIPVDKHEGVPFRGYLEEQSFVQFVLTIGDFFPQEREIL